MTEVSADPAPSQEAALSRLTLVRLGGAIRNFATSEVGTRAATLAGVLLALLLAINGLNVVNSYVGRYFMTALERRDSHEFLRQAFLAPSPCTGKPTSARGPSWPASRRTSLSAPGWPAFVCSIFTARRKRLGRSSYR